MESTAPGRLTVSSTDALTTTVVGGASSDIAVRPTDTVVVALGDDFGEVDLRSLPKCRRFEFRGGAGSNTVVVNGADLQCSVRIVVDRATGLSQFWCQGARLRKKVTVVGGIGGTSQMYTDVRATTLDAGLSVAYRAGSNSFTFADSVANGPVSLVCVAGTLVGYVADTRFLRGFRWVGGVGDDRITCEPYGKGGGTEFSGSVSIRGGGGNDTIGLSLAAKFRRAPVVDGGAGMDSLTLGALELPRGVVLLGGDGADMIDLSAFHAGGTVSVRAGGGDDVVRIATDLPCVPSGNVTLDGGDGADTLMGAEALVVPQGKKLRTKGFEQ